MNSIGDLTPEQYQRLLDEYFAAPAKRTKMTDAEVKDLASRLNHRINVPLVNETKEEKILVKVILRVDRFLYDNLPNEFYDLLRSSDSGIDDDEAKRLIVRLAKLANEKIDLPYIPEQAEYVAVRWVIAFIVNGARRKLSSAIVQEREVELEVPSEPDAPDSSLERMLL